MQIWTMKYENISTKKFISKIKKKGYNIYPS
jgi:hypothetical protein